MWYKNFGRSFFRFIIIHALDRQTDRQTDISAMANTALYSMQRGKDPFLLSSLKQSIQL